MLLLPHMKSRLLLAPLVAPMILLIFHQRIEPTSAMFNCFTPSLYKMGKGGALQSAGIYGSGQQHSGERASWYPQSQAQQKQYYPNYFPGYYGESPMKMLFRPKWGQMSSLFGPKKWMDWRMGATGFQRPPYGGYMTPVAQTLVQPQPAAGGYQQQPGLYADQLLNMAALPAGGTQTRPAQTNLNLNNPNLYSPQQQLYAGNDGWSVPFNQQQQLNVRPNQQQQQQLLNTYDSYSVSPGSSGSMYAQPPTKQQQSQYDNYGTKGGSARQQQYNTTKNILVADGGYNSFDAHSMNHYYSPSHSGSDSGRAPSVNSLLESGYAYPDWYSSSVDSPAKQIVQHQLRRRQQQLLDKALQRRRTMMMMAGI